MKTIAAAVIASLFAIAPATAAPKAAPTAEPSPAASVAPASLRNANTRYCYKTEITGSRLITKVCKTRADWKDQGIIVPADL
jgi:hypothetical protein